MIDKLRLLNEDVLIKAKSINSISKSPIHIVSQEEQRQAVNFFEVIKVSDKVTDVKVGDTVAIAFMDHTIPVHMEVGEVAITDISKILAVIE